MTQKQQFENHRELSEKRIVVLGESSGIGLAVAQQVVARGARAIIASSNADRVKQAVATLDGKAEGHGLSAGAHCKEVDLAFAITRCRIGDETRLSLLGKATFLETYADSTEAADLLSFVETEHSVARYRSWLSRVVHAKQQDRPPAIIDDRYHSGQMIALGFGLSGARLARVHAGAPHTVRYYAGE
jgi:short chain dehydrogenase